MKVEPMVIDNNEELERLMKESFDLEKIKKDLRKKGYGKNRAHTKKKKVKNINKKKMQKQSKKRNRGKK